MRRFVIPAHNRMLGRFPGDSRFVVCKAQAGYRRWSAVELYAQLSYMHVTRMRLSFLLVLALQCGVNTVGT